MNQKAESNRLTDLVQRLRGEHGTEPWQINPAAKIAADAIEAQAKRIAELEKEINCWHEAANWPESSPLQLRSRIAELKQGLMQSVSIEVKKSTRIAELEAALKPFVPDTDMSEEEYTSVWNHHLIQARKVLGDKSD